jgi:beta-lactamase regulating signal transducer with metallopeptidase domain
MTHELVGVLYRCTLVATGAILIVLAMRWTVCRSFGARAVYRLWLIVPFAIVAALLPAPVRSLAPTSWTSVLDMANAPMAVATPAVTPAFDPLFALLCIWLGGMLVALAIFVWQQRRYLLDLGRLARIDARTLRAGNSRNGPALIGALRPRIVLPQDFESRYAPHERELVLAHERTHLLRGDAQINALVVALRCLQWFNPVVHLAAARFRFDQELACDATVIERFPEARRCYADVMLKTQLAGQARQELRLPIGCHWPSGHPLKERITMLKRPLPGRARAALGLALAIALTGASSFAAWAAQPAAANPAGSTQADPPEKIAAAAPVGERDKPVSSTSDKTESREAKAALEQRSIEASMPWKFSLGRELGQTDGEGC